MIIVEDIQKDIKKHRILKEINFSLEDNQIVALVGNNGAGKTTLMKVISGILDINGGSIHVNNENKSDYLEWAHNNVAYQSTNERDLSYKNTAKDNIIYYGILKGTKKKQILENLNYYLKYIKFENELVRKVEELSTGQKKIVKLLAVFCCNCKYLILDEPTEGLDIENINLIKDILIDMSKKRGKVLVISSHDLSFLADISTRYLFLKNGQVIKTIDSKLEVDSLTEIFVENQGEENEKIL